MRFCVVHLWNRCQDSGEVLILLKGFTNKSEALLWKNGGLSEADKSEQDGPSYW